MKFTTIFFLALVHILRGHSQTGEIGEQAYAFKLADTLGNIVVLEEFEGKTLIVDVWYTGCSGCALFYKNKLSVLENQFGHQEDVVFLSISLDKDFDTWKASINRGEYTSVSAVNLYTNGMGTKHPLLSFYNIRIVPHVHIIGKTGRIADIIERPSKLTVEQIASRIIALL